MTKFSTGRAVALAIVLSLGLGACAKNTAELDGGLGGAGGYGSGQHGGPGSVEEFATSVGDRVFFESDQTELNERAQATLDKQAAWLNRYGRYHFVVEGHADERGTREYNFALGSRRAESVKSYLVGKGVSAGRIKTISYGKERPVATCDDITCWSQNRRAVTVLDGAPQS